MENLLKWRTNALGVALGTGYNDFMCDAAMMDGLAKESGRRIDVLAVIARNDKGGAAEVTAWQSSVGKMRFAAIQDWMCEPFIIDKTRLSVCIHQQNTVASYQRLRRLAPDVPWLPVLQGFKISEYFDCLRLYDRAGIDLTAFETVGVGSVCRRQKTNEAAEIVRELARAGLKLHGFGLKLQGLRKSAPYLKSADSMAWSFAARNSAPLPGCPHKSCANCAKFAELWRTKALSAVENCSRQQFMGFEI